jgi:hypothetical protein
MFFLVFLLLVLLCLMARRSESKSQEFLVAAQEGNLPLVKTLSMDPEVDLDCKYDLTATPFFWACWNNHSDVVRYLLDFKQRPIKYNYQNRYNQTPFSGACKNESKSVIKMLLADRRIDINKGCRTTSTPFSEFSSAGDIRTIELLLASGRQLDTTKKETAMKTVAFIAEHTGNEDIAALIEKFEKDPEGTREALRKEIEEDENKE